MAAFSYDTSFTQPPYTGNANLNGQSPWATSDAAANSPFVITGGGYVFVDPLSLGDGATQNKTSLSTLDIKKDMQVDAYVNIDPTQIDIAQFQIAVSNPNDSHITEKGMTLQVDAGSFAGVATDQIAIVNLIDDFGNVVSINQVVTMTWNVTHKLTLKYVASTNTVSVLIDDVQKYATTQIAWQQLGYRWFGFNWSNGDFSAVGGKGIKLSRTVVTGTVYVAPPSTGFANSASSLIPLGVL